MESPADAGIDPAGSAESSFRGMVGAQLRLSVDDPDAWYAGGDTHPWYQYSTITHSDAFMLRVTNEGRRAAGEIQLLVAIPGDVDEFGWSITIGNPGVVYSSRSEFDHVLLTDTHYPKPLQHDVYWRQGNARFVVIPGPSVLDPGMTWEIAVQLYRGTTENFMVHFDAAGVRCFANPLVDVTAQPPYEEGGGEERAPVWG